MMTETHKYRLGERRIRPGSDPGEPVEVEEWRSCKCQYCEITHHWFLVVTMSREAADRIVESHNRTLGRI